MYNVENPFNAINMYANLFCMHTHTIYSHMTDHVTNLKNETHAIVTISQRLLLASLLAMLAFLMNTCTHTQNRTLLIKKNPG